MSTSNAETGATASEEQPAGAGELARFSDALAEAVETAGRTVVRVDGRRRRPGSGIVWAADGLIVTADHVVERDEDLSVGLPDGHTVGATIVARDPGTDLALLRAHAAAPAPIRRGPPPRVGHLALIVARPGESLATSIGVVSAIGGPSRTRRGGRLDRVIWTDAGFYPGFSGGPLIDTAGQMLGLATSHFGAGAGLVISLETIERVAGTLLRHGRIRRGVLGVYSQPVGLPESLKRALGLSQDTALLIVGVENDGPADRGGLLIGDTLIALDGQPVQTTEDLQALLGSERAGREASVRVIRGGEIRDLTVTIGER
ncbi:MAG: serine protease [Chloroflexi bacterium]|nr:serine protease [Chloroflexota bacterium]